MKHQGAELRALLDACGALETTLSEDQAERLLAFERLLRDRAVGLGMVAASDTPRLRERHLLDCLRAAPLAAGALSAYDLGSGAGLPGVVIAIAVPTMRVGLVESRRARIAFLELAIEELGLPNARVHAGRVEDLTEPVEVCFARAFAPPDRAWEAARHLLGPGGRLIYFAGGGEREIAAPTDAVLVVVRSPVLESAGPLVIMSQP